MINCEFDVTDRIKCNDQIDMVFYYEDLAKRFIVIRINKWYYILFDT